MINQYLPTTIYYSTMNLEYPIFIGSTDEYSNKLMINRISRNFLFLSEKYSKTYTINNEDYCSFMLTEANYTEVIEDVLDFAETLFEEGRTVVFHLHVYDLALKVIDELRKSSNVSNDNIFVYNFPGSLITAKDVDHLKYNDVFFVYNVPFDANSHSSLNQFSDTVLNTSN